MTALVFVLGGAALLLAARLWWRRIVGFNRTLSGPPRNTFEHRAELATRWYGTAFLTACGLALLIRGLTLIGG